MLIKPEFVKAYLNFVTEALEYLRKNYPPLIRPYRGFEKCIFHKNGGYTSYVGSRLDVAGLISNEWKYFYEIPEFTKLITCFPYEKTEDFKHELFSPFYRYLEHTRSLICNNKILLNILSPYIQMWNSSSLDFVTLCYINGLQLIKSPFELSSGITLRNLSPLNKTKFWSSSEMMTRKLDAFDFQHVKTMIEIRNKLTLKQFYQQPHNYQAANELISKTISSIRISSSCPAGFFFVKSYYEPQPNWCMGSCSWSRNDLKSNDNIAIEFGNNNKKKCKTYFEGLNCSYSDSLHLAIRRFNMSFTKEIYDDCVIDLVIALEACLLVCIR